MRKSFAFAIGIGIMIMLGFALWKRGWFDRSPEEDRSIIISEADIEDLAFIIYDASDGMRAPALTQTLIGIVAINTRKRTGRGYDVIFSKMLEYVPEQLETRAVTLHLVRAKNGIIPGYSITGTLFGEGASLARAKVLAQALLEAQKAGDLASLLPDGRENLVCVDKVYYANPGRLFGALGKRLNVPESSFPALHQEDRRSLEYTDEDGAQFYCPNT